MNTGSLPPDEENAYALEKLASITTILDEESKMNTIIDRKCGKYIIPCQFLASPLPS